MLVFGAIDYETEVWVNGQQMGANAEGYLPFSLDVTYAIESGENTVVLHVFDPIDLSENSHGK